MASSRSVSPSRDLTAGNHTIRIQYDFTAGGHKAYDFLAYWNGWVSPPKCSPSGGGILVDVPVDAGPQFRPLPVRTTS